MPRGVTPMDGQDTYIEELDKESRRLEEECRQLRAETWEIESKVRMDEAETSRLKAQLQRDEAETSRLKAQLESERALWSSEATKDRLAHGDALLMHRLEVLDDILGREDSLRAFTGMPGEEFGTLAAEMGREIARLGGAPLFKDDPRHRRRAGNPCRLYMRHGLLLALEQKRLRMSRDILPGIFGIDQPEISLQLDLCDRVLERVLPTGRIIMGRIARCETNSERRRFIPGRGGGAIFIDGTRSQHVLPRDGRRQEGMHSDEIEEYLACTLIAANSAGAIVGVGETVPGGFGDPRMAPRLGRAFPSLLDEHTAKPHRIRAIGDGELSGLGRMFPGGKWIRLGGGEPAAAGGGGQGAENAEIGRERNAAERAIGRLRGHAVLRDPFRGTLGGYNRQVNIVSGLVNRHLLYDEIQAGRGAVGELMARRRKKRLERGRRR